MSFSVADAITRMTRAVPQFSTLSLQVAYLNDVHRDLVGQLPLDARTEDINMVANQQDYTYNEDDLVIWAGEMLYSSTDRRVLLMTDIQQLDALEPGWRNAAPSQPGRMALWRDSSGPIVTMIPAPIDTTSAGYPVLRLHVSRYEALTSDGNLPKGIASPDVYVWGAVARFCAEKEPKRYALYKGLYDEAYKREERLAWSRVPLAPKRTVSAQFPAWGVR